MKQQIIWTHDLVEQLEGCTLTSYLCLRANAIWGKGAHHTVGQLIEEQMVGFLSDPERPWLTIQGYARWGGRFWEGDENVEKPYSTYREEFLQRLRDQPNRRVVLPLTNQQPRSEGPAL